MTIDQHGEYLAGLEPLPLEADAPAFEEEPRPALAFELHSWPKLSLRT
jgi:hypothetical protein